VLQRHERGPCKRIRRRTSPIPSTKFDGRMNKDINCRIQQFHQIFVESTSNTTLGLSQAPSWVAKGWVPRWYPILSLFGTRLGQHWRLSLNLSVGVWGGCEKGGGSDGGGPGRRERFQTKNPREKKVSIRWPIPTGDTSVIP